MKWNNCITSWVLGCLAIIFVVSFYTLASGSLPTFQFGDMTSSSTNLLSVSTSNGYMCDCFGSIIGVVSIYYYSWSICGYFSSWPLPLSIWGSLVYTLPLVLSHWALFHYPHFRPMSLFLLDFHIQNLERFFDILIVYTCIFLISSMLG
jgi:hypothetical protein